MCVYIYIYIHIYIYTYIHIHIYTYIYRALDCDHFLRVRVKIWHGRTCASAWSALLQSARCQPQHIVAGERFHWSREERRFQHERFSSVEPGLRPFHTARVCRAEAVQKRRVCRAGAACAHCAFTGVSARARRCTQRTERNGGFGFQTKVKDRFLNQRRWTCWYSCRKNMQVLSATASLVLLWKACYLCCLLHVTLWRLSLFF